MLKTENIQNIYRLSPMQEGFLFHSLYEKDSLSYFMRVVYKLEGYIDPELVQQSLSILFQRHDILRTVFNFTKAAFPLQVVLKTWEPEFKYVNIAYLDREQQGEYLQRYKQQDLQRGFDLTKDRLMRVGLLQTGSREFVFVLSHHHIIIDGWSWNVLMEEYNEIYDSLKNRRSAQLQPVVPYHRFIHYVEKQDKDADRNFWQKYLADYNQVAFIPKSLVNNNHEYSVKRIEYFISEKKARRLIELAQNAEVTLSTVIRVLWGIVLAKYNNNRDVIYGAVIAGRPSAIERVEQMVGLFINTIPVRIKYGENTTFSELLRIVQFEALEADGHSYFPLSQIQSVSELKNQLIDHVLTFANYPSPYQTGEKIQHQQSIVADAPKVSDFEVFDQTNYDFALTVVPGHKINFVFAYNEHAYEHDEMMKLGERLERVIDQVIENPAVQIDTIQIVTEKDKELLFSLNNTMKEYPWHGPVHKVFEQQVQLMPAKLAVVSGKNSLTYEELNHQANKLAHYLRSMCGVQRGDVVGIMLQRNEKAIISIIGALKAGACYVFIDPTYPHERLKYIAANAGIRCMVLESADIFNVSFLETPIFAIDIQLDSIDQRPENPDAISQPGDPAYLIYTSGSTGKPKGIAISHRSLLNTQYWRKDFYGFDKNFTTLQFASFTFDSSVNDIFSMLLWGGSLVLLDEDERIQIDKINALLEKYAITNFNVVPGLYRSLVNDLHDRNRTLKAITLAGEKLTASLVNSHFDRFPNIPLVNEYGPTENAICSTAIKITNKVQHDPSIGHPISNTQVFLLDHAMNLLPPGVMGEIYLSGHGLADGYVQNEDLTSKQFLPHPFEQGTRIYRSGDIGRWNKSGELEFMGRFDMQVKIRGYRVEPAEIESVLLQHEMIKEAAVVVKKTQVALVAFYAGAAGLSDNVLRTYLATHMPAYMIPAVFKRLDQLPLTSNGKIDRKQLVEWAEVEESASTGEMDEQPMSEKESLLATVWQEVLGKRKIGLHDEFFKSGGDSIKAIQIASRCYKAGFKADVKDIFENPTIARLAKVIKPLTTYSSQDLVQGEFPLTPIQRRFFQLPLADRHHYNQSVMLSTPERLQPAYIKEVFSFLQVHHDMLRATYRTNSDGETVQQIKKESHPVWFSEYDFTNSNDVIDKVRQQSNEIQSGIDLENGPLLKLALFHTGQVDLLLVVIHHLVIDTLSWRILLEDIETLYQQSVKKQTLSLPPKTDSFKSWSAGLQQYANSGKLMQEKNFWSQVTNTGFGPLPRDKNPVDASNTLQDTRVQSFNLPEQVTETLLTRVHGMFHTDINDVLLLALAKAVKEVWGIEKVAIDLEGHGRENILPGINITRTIGWFTTIYPVVIHLAGEWSLQRQLIEVKDNLRRIPNKGIGYGILKYLSANGLDLPVDKLPEPPISFNYLGQLDADISNTSFQLAGDLMGYSMSQQQSRQYELEVNAMVLGQRLQVNAQYNYNQYSEKIIGHFMEKFELALTEICAYCSLDRPPILTSGDLTYKHLSFEQINALKEIYGEIEDVYPLTASQEGLLYHYLFDKNTTAYFEQVSYSLQGELDPGIVSKSLNILSERHAALRTAFVYENMERPLQVLMKNRPVDFVHENIEQLSPAEQEKYVARYKEKEREYVFDLATSRLVRVVLLQRNAGHFDLIWSHHHIIMDGWCIVVLTHEFWNIYNHYKYGQPLELLPVTPYKNYIDWLGKLDKTVSATYWAGYLSGYDHLTGLPGKKIQPAGNYISSRYIYELSEEQTRGLHHLKERYHVTLNTIVQAIWGILTGKYNYTDDVVFGAIASGRPAELEGVENIVGLFINMIPVRVRFQSSQSFTSLLKQLQAEALQSEPHHYSPLADIQASSGLKQQLLDHFITFTNYPEAAAIENALQENDQPRTGDRLQISGVDMFEHTNYDFNLIIVPNKKLKLEVSYNQAAFDDRQVKRIIHDMVTIINQVTTNEAIAVGTICLVSEEEKIAILQANEETFTYDSKVDTVCDLFLRQAVARPHAVAVSCGSEAMTYAELDERSQKLAACLHQQLKATSCNRVGVLVDRSVSLLTVLMGVLRAGASYVPLDIKLPPERIRYMLEDSGCKIVITQQSLAHLIPSQVDIFDIDNYAAATAAGQAVSKPVPTDGAYIIYTSGTTGKPKGVIISHRALANFLVSIQKTPGLNNGDKVLATSAYSFDISILELFLPLVAGARVVVAPQTIVQDPFEIQKLVETEQPALMQGTPTMWKLMLSTGWKGNKNMKFVSGGEPMPDELAKKLLPACSELWNMYGPTETTIYSTLKKISHENEQITVGGPIQNTRIYVLDKDGQLLPAGLKGAIWIGGDGLADGYINQPALTADRFIADPFVPGNLMYNSGDMGSLTPEGEIIIHHRVDDQVKIRGHRVEPRETENCLAQIPGIEKALVIGRKNITGNYLAAYFTAKEKMDITAINKLLMNELPPYMIPELLVQLDAFPLTPGGKIDRKALPEQNEVQAGQRICIPAENAVEQALIEILEQVLDIKPVGRFDNFFELGGHSIKALQAVTRIKQRLKTDIRLNDFFAYPRVNDLAVFIQSMQKEESAKTADSQTQEYLEITL